MSFVVVSLDFVPSRHPKKANRQKAYKQIGATDDVLNIRHTGVAIVKQRRLPDTSSSRRLGFGLRAINVGSVVDNVTL
jgi:hypothetical protein